jgi:hypothetical protein
MPIDDDSREIPGSLPDAGIGDFCQSLIGLTFPEAELRCLDYGNVDFLSIPEDRGMLLEIDGEQRRESKRRHYSIEIGPSCRVPPAASLSS